MLTPPLPIRILIADDHELFRDGLRILVKQMDGIQLIGEAANGKELLRLAATHHPDVILTDIQMPEMDGLTATRQILQDHSSIFVVAMSMFGDDHLIVSMLQAGARGY